MSFLLLIGETYKVEEQPPLEIQSLLKLSNLQATLAHFMEADTCLLKVAVIKNAMLKVATHHIFNGQ